MGAYLNTPIREKDSIDNDTHTLRYGASSMQGWRMSQEDAHNCCADFDPDTNTSLFAVYDGHGGSEVAQYTASKFPEFIKNQSLYKENKLTQALEEGFLEFDKLLTQEEVIKDLKVLAGVEEQPRNEESDDEDTETAMLCEEADMPIEKLMERYGAAKGPLSASQLRNLRKKENIQSPAIRAQKNQPSLADNGNNDDIKTSLEDKLVNGCSPDSAEKSTHSKTSSDHSESAKNEAEVQSKDTKNGCSSTQPTDSGDSHEDSSGEPEEAQTGDGDAQVSSSSDSPGGASSCVATAADTSGSKEGCEPGSSTGRTRKQRKNIIPEEGEDESSFDEDEEDTDEDDSENEDMWESASDSDDEDDEDLEIGGFVPKGHREEDEEEDEDEEGGAGEGMEFMGGGGEEPGSDSGCTAVVALLRGCELYVANAGDSRCVVSRAGTAVEMSFDHKPEDDLELARITKAGGKVTGDGRVNGGLNLSRALGDHLYKRNKELPLRDQMISSLPDVKCLSLGPQDEFMVLACDGIWNVMSSQDVVSFVRDRISSKDVKLSSICEEMFEFCLAPDTMGDGTGCDNMTCIIVNLDKLHHNGDSNQGAKKRGADHCQVDSSDLPQTKRQRSCSPSEESIVRSVDS